jgi:hypothetical protein
LLTGIAEGIIREGMADDDDELPRIPAPVLVGHRIMVPLETEVVRAHRGWLTGVKLERDCGLIVELDVRRQAWGKVLGCSRDQKVHWADVRTIDIRELSSISWPIFYRVTYGDGWYVGKDGKRVYFPLQPHLPEIDLARQCTQVTLRAAVLLAVLGGVGVRCVCWLLKLLFHVEVSKSALDRWTQECADALPDAAEMAKVLHVAKPITEAHFDEIFAVGQRPKPCTMVLRDEHGRIFAIEQIERRTTETVTAFLQKVKGWGIVPRTFYVDGCEEYRAAIRIVFPDAVIQYDLFHVIQSVTKKLWKAVVSRRKDIKRRGEEATTPAYSARLQALAKRIWEHRYVFFKREEKLSDEEREELLSLMEADPLLDRVRGFMLAVWDTLGKSTTEEEARLKLVALGLRPEVIPGSPFQKAFHFLTGRFTDMIAFLCHPNVQRNSLAETGIRFLRRLEQGHDGFRGPEGLDRHLRIYQAVKYCGWTVHRFTPGLGLPPLLGVQPTGPPAAST